MSPVAPSTVNHASAARDAAESAWVHRVLADHLRRRRRPLPQVARSLFWIAVVGAAMALAWFRWIASERVLPLDLTWQAERAEWVVRGVSDDALQRWVGHRVLSVAPIDEHGAHGPAVALSALTLGVPPRWLVSDAVREASTRGQMDFGRALLAPQVALRFADAPEQVVLVEPEPRGTHRLGVMAWVLSAMAMGLFLVGASQVVESGRRVGLAYALLLAPVMVGAALTAVEWTPGLGAFQAMADVDMPLWAVIVGLWCGMAYQLLRTHPRLAAGLTNWPPSWLVWLGVVAVTAVLVFVDVPGEWWWVNAELMAITIACPIGAWRVQRHLKHPLAIAFSRISLVWLASVMLMIVTVVASNVRLHERADAIKVGATAWAMFGAVLLMVTPYVVRWRQGVRTFMAMASVALAAVCVHLLLRASGIGLVASAALTAMLAAATVVPANRAMVRWFAGAGRPSGEQLFGLLYRAARAFERSRADGADAIAQMFQAVFRPLESVRVAHTTNAIWIAPDGSSMVVPLAATARIDAADGGAGAPDDADGPTEVLVMHRAWDGARLFTEDDHTLAQRLIGQLARAVGYDRAVERGRHEERMRLAQDLHDDIGARLLTLMYRAPDAATETYVRHTLQDLKTLTRGLAAAEHALSEAAAEWKNDVAMRLEPTGGVLHWHFEGDRDARLSVVQWSALTRILRELVSNIVAHAHARHVWVDGRLARGTLTLCVQDDGSGATPPSQWGPGLGVGGVRKRAKLLGGQVQWSLREGGGVRVELQCPLDPPLAKDAAPEVG